MKKEKGKKLNGLIWVISLLCFLGLISGLVIINKDIIRLGNTQEQENTYVTADGATDYQYSLKDVTERDGLKVTKMDFHVLDDQLEVATTLENRTNKSIMGYYMEIELQDKDGNVLSTIVDNSPDIIEPKKSKEVYNCVMNMENSDKVSKARISELLKDNYANNDSQETSQNNSESTEYYSEETTQKPSDEQLPQEEVNN